MRQEFSIIYRAEAISGEPTTSHESTSVEWVPVEQIPTLTTNPSQRKRIDWALTETELRSSRELHHKS